MLTPFIAREMFIVFSDANPSGPQACRVVGPYQLVEFRAMGLWAWRNDGSDPIRVATQAVGSLNWELDGFDDPGEWGTVRIIAPPRPTSCREIEAANDWIRPTPPTEG